MNRRQLILSLPIAGMFTPALASTLSQEELSWIETLSSSDDGRAVGAPIGKPTIIELMDYACGYCKMAHAEMPKVLLERPNMRLLTRDMPLLGDNSFIAAASVKAAGAQGLSLKMHDILMSKPGLSLDTIVSSARDSGANIEEMVSLMATDDFQGKFAKSTMSQKILKLHGTPTYVSMSGRILEGFGNSKRFIEFVDGES